MPPVVDQATVLAYPPPDIPLLPPEDPPPAVGVVPAALVLPLPPFANSGWVAGLVGGLASRDVVTRGMASSSPSAPGRYAGVPALKVLPPRLVQGWGHRTGLRASFPLPPHSGTKTRHTR